MVNLYGGILFKNQVVKEFLMIWVNVHDIVLSRKLKKKSFQISTYGIIPVPLRKMNKNDYNMRWKKKTQIRSFHHGSAVNKPS